MALFRKMPARKKMAADQSAANQRLGQALATRRCPPPIVHSQNFGRISTIPHPIGMPHIADGKLGSS
jgi:hypothetical protein